MTVSTSSDASHTGDTAAADACCSFAVRRRARRAFRSATASLLLCAIAVFMIAAAPHAQAQPGRGGVSREMIERYKNASPEEQKAMREKFMSGGMRGGAPTPNNGNGSAKEEKKEEKKEEPKKEDKKEDAKSEESEATTIKRPRRASKTPTLPSWKRAPTSAACSSSASTDSLGRKCCNGFPIFPTRVSTGRNCQATHST